jgi:hypothetical protein
MKWYESKTIWFNVIVMVGAIVALPEITTAISPSTAILIQGVANIILRVWFTSQPVEK